MLQINMLWSFSRKKYLNIEYFLEFPKIRSSIITQEIFYLTCYGKLYDWLNIRSTVINAPLLTVGTTRKKRTSSNTRPKPMKLLPIPRSRKNVSSRSEVAPSNEWILIYGSFVHTRNKRDKIKFFVMEQYRR